MEVHHHPNVETKGFKEYFLEFLMIFLAVTMGFFAESLRESMAAKEKEKVYMAGIINNLKDDTAILTSTLFKQNILIAKMDSALRIPVEALRNIDKQDSFYAHFIYFFTWLAAFDQNDNTLVQLRNAGGYSVINKQDAVDSIIRVNHYYNLVNSNKLIYIQDWNKVADLAPSFIRIPFYPSTEDDPIFLRPANHVEYLTKYDKSQLEQLYTFIRIERGQLQLYNEELKHYKLLAIRLAGFLQREYGFEH